MFNLIFHIFLFFSYFALCANDSVNVNYYPEILEKNKEFYRDFLSHPKNAKQFGRNYDFWSIRNYNSKNFPTNSIEVLKSTEYDTLYPQMKWKEMGPFKKPDESLPAISGNGRINVIEFDPNDSTVIWIGSAGGGIWKSSDRGESWKISKGTDFMSVGISDILVSYEDSDVIYAATGDASGVPLFRGFSSGLIKTTDAGESWFRIGEEYLLNDSVVISDIIQHPEEPQTIFVSATNSIQRTTDAGQTWKKLKEGEWYRSMVMHPENPDILYVATFSHRDSTFIYRTTDAGNSWKTILKTDTVLRTELAVTKAAPNHIYALSAKQITADMAAFIYSNDMGENWKRISPHIDTLNLNYAQGFYNLSLMVDDRDTNKITAGGIFFYRTNDFGQSWLELQTDSIHVDYHDFKYNSADSSLYIANDGGIYRMKDYDNFKSGNYPVYEDISQGLGITQIYRLALNHMNDSVLFMGTQDNGTYKYDYGVYKHALGADGMQCFVGNENQNIVYSSDQIGNIYKSYDMGNNFEMIFEFLWQERKQWLRQFDVNPLDAHTVYAGYENLWRTYNGKNWNKISSFDTRETISAINISVADTNIFFTGKYNKLFRSLDNGQTFQMIFENIPAISSIYSDTGNPFEYYFGMSGYIDSAKVFRSMQNDEIENITYNLPNVPVNSIVKNEMTGDLIIGTDIGVFALAENSTEWKTIGDGFPRVIVNEVEILYGKGELYAATFGRGLWKLNMWSCEIAPPEILETGLIEICEDSSFSVSYLESSPLNEYFWSDGSQSKINNISKDGEYYVTAVSPEGCIAASDKIRLKTYMKPEVQLLLQSGNPVCEGSPVRLKANLIRKDTTGNDNYHYLWSNGDTTNSVEIFQSGIISLLVYSDKGCSYQTDDYEIIINPKPEKPNIYRNGKYIYTDVGQLVRWYRNGELIYTGDEFSIEIDTFGVYQAEVFNENFCSNFSNVLEVKPNNDNNLNINIYPNPVTDKLYLESFFDELTYWKYKIYDLNGRIYIDSNINEINGFLFEEINLNQLSTGFYFIEINANGNRLLFKIIKK